MMIEFMVGKLVSFNGVVYDVMFFIYFEDDFVVDYFGNFLK